MSAPDIKMYRSDTLQEVGTESNPVDFGLCNGGIETDLSYDILLYNDKDGTLGSEDAKNITIELLRPYVSQQWTSDGTGGQLFTVSYIPAASDVEEEVIVDGAEWRRINSFAGLLATDEVYMFDYSTGVLTFGNGAEGKIPPNGTIIKITYTPDKNTYGKQIYIDKWASVKSDGVMANNVHVGSTTPEESIKVDNNTIQVLHYPKLTEVIGVWDNDTKTGTNYYTGGSYVADSGIINLGTPLTTDTPYVEYKYQVKDDEETTYTELGDGVQKGFDNPIPRTNAKRLKLRVSIPDDAETEGGAYLKVIFRIYYQF